MKYDECKYWFECKQEKNPDVCIKNYEKCLIFKMINNLNKNRIKTGLERFITKYGEDWRSVAFAGDNPVAGISTNRK